MTLGQGFALPGEVGGWRLYGRTGTVLARREGGRFSYTVWRIRPGDQSAEPLPVPERLRATPPGRRRRRAEQVVRLFPDFVADIQGEPHQPYSPCATASGRWSPSTPSAPASGWTLLPACGADDVRLGRLPNGFTSAA
ncbi:MAG TPA: hypothetical protein VGP33_05020 [Chloroflexota bacterium]|nr:hypothetical protein [Chloroflexota bacterium]